MMRVVELVGMLCESGLDNESKEGKEKERREWKGRRHEQEAKPFILFPIFHRLFPSAFYGCHVESVG